MIIKLIIFLRKKKNFLNNIINIKGGEKNEETNTINNNSNNNGDSAIKFSNISGCNQEGSNPIMRGRGAGNIIGKVANDFGNY